MSFAQKSRYRLPRSLLAALLFGLAPGSFASQTLPVTAPEADSAALRLQTWQQLLEHPHAGDESTLLKQVNHFVNANVVFGLDQLIWGETDYWATPLETLSRGQGDCEDIAIAKYFTLLRLGVPAEKLLLTYVKALQPNSAHMVLAYYARPDAEPLILDNLVPQIRPAGQRRDLQPVYAFNDHGLFLGLGFASPSRQPSQQPSRWHDLSARALADGSAPQAPRG